MACNPPFLTDAHTKNVAHLSTLCRNIAWQFSVGQGIHSSTLLCQVCCKEGDEITTTCLDLSVAKLYSTYLHTLLIVMMVSGGGARRPSSSTPPLPPCPPFLCPVSSFLAVVEFVIVLSSCLTPFGECNNGRGPVQMTRKVETPSMWVCTCTSRENKKQSLIHSTTNPIWLQCMLFSLIFWTMAMAILRPFAIPWAGKITPMP